VVQPRPLTLRTQETGVNAPANDLTIDVTTHDDVTVVSLGGEIDLATQGELRAMLNDQIVSGNVNLVLDLTDVSFLDSTGIGALIGTRRRVHAFQGSLVIVCPDETLLKIFTITGLEKVFDIRPTLDSALAGQPG
jgi:anti-sigma B factor antagonist